MLWSAGLALGNTDAVARHVRPAQGIVEGVAVAPVFTASARRLGSCSRDHRQVCTAVSLPRLWVNTRPAQTSTTLKVSTSTAAVVSPGLFGDVGSGRRARSVATVAGLRSASNTPAWEQAVGGEYPGGTGIGHRLDSVALTGTVVASGRVIRIRSAPAASAAHPPTPA